jgi:serine/threonine-protein kinase RsbW
MVGETPTSTAATSKPDRIEVSVPLRAEFASTLRTLMASIGAEAGFSVDELDDLRLALSEVFSVLADAAVSGSRALVSITVGSGDLLVSIRSDQADMVFELDELAAGILQSVTDRYEIGPGSVEFSVRSTELGTGPHRP